MQQLPLPEMQDEHGAQTLRRAVRRLREKAALLYKSKAAVKTAELVRRHTQNRTTDPAAMSKEELHAALAELNSLQGFIR